MRVKSTISAAALATLAAAVPTTASAYQLCALMIDTRNGADVDIHVGGISHRILGLGSMQEKCDPSNATATGAVFAQKAYGTSPQRDCNFGVDSGNTAKIVVQVSIQYTIENKQNPYYVTCSKR